MVDQYKLLKVNRELFVHFVMAKYLGAETVTEQLDWVIGHSGVRPKEGLQRRTLNNLIMPGTITIFFFFPILLNFIEKQGLRQHFFTDFVASEEQQNFRNLEFRRENLKFSEKSFHFIGGNLEFLLS